MVCGPWSSPLPRSSPPRSVIRSIVDGGSRVGAGVGLTRSRFEGFVTLGLVAGYEPADPTLGDPVIACDLRLTTVFDEHGGDDHEPSTPAETG
jgi:hypothetical protein